VLRGPRPSQPSVLLSKLIAGRRPLPNKISNEKKAHGSPALFIPCPCISAPTMISNRLSRSSISDVFENSHFFHSVFVQGVWRETKAVYIGINWLLSTTFRSRRKIMKLARISNPTKPERKRSIVFRGIFFRPM
jgi:hypothetical protein